MVNKIWLGEERFIVLIAFIAVFLQSQVWQTVTQIGESQRYTIRVQILNVIIYSSHLILVLILLYLEYLTIENLFFITIFEFLFATFIAYIIIPIKI